MGQSVTGANIPSGTTVTAINYGSSTLTLSNKANLTGTNTLTFGTGFARTLTLTGTNTGANAIDGNLADSATGGSLSLAKTGAGTWVLAGSNTYSGGTTVTAGTLLAGSINALSTNSAFVISGGTLDTSGYASTIASLNIASGTLNLGYGNVLTVTGTASLAGTLNLSGTPASMLPETLMAYNSETGTFAAFTGVPTGDQLQYGATALQLVVVTPTGPANLVYNDASGSGTFDTVNANFTNGTSTVVYSNTSNGAMGGDNVTFDDTAPNYNVSIPVLLQPSSTTVNTNSSTGYTFSGAGGIGGFGPLIKTGTGLLTLDTSNSYTGGTNISGGRVTLGVAGALPAGTNLTIAAGAVLYAANLGNAVALTVGSLSLAGKLDLNNNDLVVHSSSLNAVNALVASGFNQGVWNNSTGITSLAAAQDTSHLTALGVITNDNGSSTPLYGSGGTLASSFGGSTPLDGDVLVKYTYYGDANLDGKVDGTDYSRIDANYGTSATGWYNGDFNYDGVINGSDYTLIDNAYNSQYGTIQSAVAAPTAEIAPAAGTSSVPEPATLGLFGFAALGLLGRRRRM